MACCNQMSTVAMIIAFLLFLVNMGSPTWVELEFAEICTVYYGPWGVLTSDDCPEGSDYTEWDLDLIEGSLKSDIEGWQAGVTLAFLFGFIGSIAQCAADSSRSRNSAITSAVTTAVAILGAIISLAKAGEFLDLLDGTDAEYSASFYMQIIAMLLALGSLVAGIRGLLASSASGSADGGSGATTAGSSYATNTATAAPVAIAMPIGSSSTSGTKEGHVIEATRAY